MRRLAWTAFGGSACEIIADAPSRDLVAIQEEVAAFERRLTRFDPASELSALNASAGARFAATPLLRAVLTTALWAYQETSGLVNAAVHDALVQAGYDRTIEKVRVVAVPAAGRPTPPLPAVLEVGRAHARLRHGYAIDLGGIGKGWLADRLAERFDNAAVNLGGDVRAVGCGPEGAGWPIGACDGATVVVHNAGVATSGTVRRRWVGGHHLIDPRLGRPARTDVAAVSVVAADAVTAEAWAKAAAISGSAAGRAWLATRDATYRMVAA